jgi:hypothetical protein
MMHVPTVSVIMAAYNGATLIGETIASVLAQTMRDFELIVVDDCSTDDTLARLRALDDPRIQVIAAESNEGPVRTRNRAYALARGRYIAGLDQDDICRPDRFARQVAYLDDNPGIVLVGSAADQLERGKVRPAPAPHRTSPTLLRFLMNLRNPLVWSSVMIRAAAARRLDPFTRPEILYAEDFDLYHRLAPLGGIARIDEPLVVYRCHPGGVSRRFMEQMTASAVAVLTMAYTPIFGEEAGANATLIARHFAGKEAAPDRETLARLADIFDRLLAHFTTTEAIDPASAELLGEEASRLWWRVVHTSVRSGRLSVKEARSVRPASPFVHEAPKRDGLLVAGMVGRTRGLRPRLGSIAALY